MNLRLSAGVAVLAALGSGTIVAFSKPGPEPPVTVTLTALSSLKSGPMRTEDPRIAEINAFDPAGPRIYVVNPQSGGLDVIDASDPTALIPATPPSLDIVSACQAALGLDCPVQSGSEPNSVAIRGRLMGVALGSPVRTENGYAAFFELQGSGAPVFVAAVEVGALPDMITFTPDGAYALTANEGEPSLDYTIDPPGSVSIITVARLGAADAVQQVDFSRFDKPGPRQKLEREGVRIFGPGASPSQDLEPEYIAADDRKAYVTLQENNALAIIDIGTAAVERIVPLGLKDHSIAGLGLDPSDQDSATNAGINIGTWPVSGLYQPDAVHAFQSRGRTYLIMANEGDAREYDPSGPTVGYVEAIRAGNAAYVLDPAAFPNAAALKAPAALGRLNVSTASGDLDGDGDFDRIDVFGGRSVSVRDPEGHLVWDSGDLLERLAAQADALVNGVRVGLFNTTNTANARENRSDDKGIEPESVVVGEVNGRPYAFVGLERDSGIVVFDLSRPESPALVRYVNNRKFPLTASGTFAACGDTPATDCGDLGPEGLTFVTASQSPTGRALLVVSNEASSTTTVWEIQ